MRLLVEKPTPLPVIDDGKFDRLIRLHPNGTGWGDHPPHHFLEPLQRHGFLPFGWEGPIPDQFAMRITETETLEEALDYARLALISMVTEFGEPEEYYDLDGGDQSRSAHVLFAEWYGEYWALTLVVNQPATLTTGASVVFALRRRVC